MKKRIQNIYLIIIIIIMLFQTLYKIYIDTTKEDFFIDEIYSYGLMNNDEAFIFKRDDFSGNWHTGEYFNDYTVINSNEIFNISSVYRNQVEDVHPPLYYLLLRIAATGTINYFTKWTGLILNIIIYIFSAILVYKIGKILFRDRLHSILLLVLYGFSLFSMQNTTYIRMYQLLELQMLLLMHWHLKNYNKKLNYKELFKLGIYIITGFLTHYYYAVAAIAFYILNMIRYLKTKNKKDIIKYNVCLVISAMIAVLIFPASIEHIFSGYRGKASINKLMYTGSAKPFFLNVLSYLKLISENMFNIVELKYLIIPVILLIIYMMIKKRKVNMKVIYITSFIIIYVLIIAKSAPYSDLRYIMSAMVFVLIVLEYFVKNGLQILIKNKKILYAICIIMTIILSVPLVQNDKLKYMYYGNQQQIEKLEEYASIPAIYIYHDADMTQNKFVSNVNYLRILENVYILNNNELFFGEDSIYDEIYSDGFMYFEMGTLDDIELNINIDEILEGIDTSNGILICSEGYSTEYFTEYFVKNTEFNNSEKIIGMDNIRICRIYK